MTDFTFGQRTGWSPITCPTCGETVKLRSGKCPKCGDLIVDLHARRKLEPPPATAAPSAPVVAPPAPSAGRRFVAAARQWLQHTFWPWYQRQTRKVQVIIAAAVLFGLCGSCAMLTNAGASSNPSTVTIPTSAPQSGQQTAQHTSTTPAATKAPPTPTPTPKPLTPTQQLTKIASNASQTQHQSLTVDYDSSSGLVQVTEVYSADDAIFSGAIKMEAYSIEQAIWTHFKGLLTEVDISFQGPTQDQYGNTSTGVIAYCDLTVDTEAMFNWSNLDYDQAWNDYDTVWMISGL